MEDDDYLLLATPLLPEPEPEPPRPRFTPDSIMGEFWRIEWVKQDLGNKTVDECQKAYVQFCRHHRLSRCWEPYGPYPVPDTS